MQRQQQLETRVSEVGTAPPASAPPAVQVPPLPRARQCQAYLPSHLRPPRVGRQYGGLHAGCGPEWLPAYVPLSACAQGLGDSDAGAEVLPLLPISRAIRGISTANRLGSHDVHVVSGGRPHVGRQLIGGHGQASLSVGGSGTGGARRWPVGSGPHAFPVPQPPSHRLSKQRNSLQPSCAGVGTAMPNPLGNSCRTSRKPIRYWPDGSQCWRCSAKRQRRRRRAAKKAKAPRFPKAPKQEK